jgi:hypothetical protein
MTNFRDTWQYRLISEHYTGKIANRSKLPYIKHIDEGVEILNRIGADECTITSFILHPLFQGDKDLFLYWEKFICEGDYELGKLISREEMLLCIEYRNVANAFLSKHQGIRTPTLSPIHEVNLMLIADKVQNQADFYRYQSYQGADATMSEFHYKKLETYFVEWRDILTKEFPSMMAKLPLYSIIEQRQLFPVESYTTNKIVEGAIYDFAVDP